MAVLLRDAGVHAGDLLLVGDIGVQRQVRARGFGEIDADDRRALRDEQLRARRADAACRAGDDADLAVETSQRSVLRRVVDRLHFAVVLERIRPELPPHA